MNEINDYLSKADEEIAKNVMYRVYGMPGPLFMENEVTPTPGPEPEPSFNIPFYVENITQETETLTITGFDWSEHGNYLEFPVEYSTDSTTWNSFGTTGETPLTRTLQPGDKVYLRATTDVWYEYQDEPYIDHGCAIFGVSKVGGNIMSLLYGSNFTGNETTFPTGSRMNFSDLLIDITYEDEYNRNLVSASELILPATTLTPGCYSGMFQGCSSLTTAPVLPATTLADYCYSGMFYYCTSLTQTPALPATTLAEECYSGMFYYCTSLTQTPALPATTLAEECYSSMFMGCESLTTAPTLPATTLTNSCYQSMFNGCTSLTTAPELPATTLAQSCYNSMFNGCTSLTTAPELPATTLANFCYNSMFMGCTNLNYIKCLATDILAQECTSGWVYNVAVTGTFVKDPSMSSWTTGVNGIPEGWTVEDAA